jgi:hypothetical protein
MKIFSSRYEIFARCYTYTRALIQFLVLEIWLFLSRMKNPITIRRGMKNVRQSANQILFPNWLN